MVLLDSTDGFLSELVDMFELCKERGAGTVYVTVKKNERNSKGAKAAGGGGGDGGEGWLARAKISNKKKRKISIAVAESEIAQFRERIQKIRSGEPACTIAGGTKKRGRRSGDGKKKSGKRAKEEVAQKAAGQ